MKYQQKQQNSLPPPISDFETYKTPDQEAFKQTSHLELLAFTGSAKNPLFEKTSSPTKLMNTETFP